MSLDRVGELHQIFASLSEARNVNLSDFPYSKVNNDFKAKLKEYLKEAFGDKIQFDRAETFAYFQAHYEGVGIEINTWDGLIFTIEDENEVSLVDDFKDIFNMITGTEAICSYNFCSNEDGERTCYPTFEWNLEPERRLYELVVFRNYPGYVSDLEDYYTRFIIQSLGQQLFTVEGFKRLFKNGYEDISYNSHKRRQIQKLNPNIDDSSIYNWISSSKKIIELSPDVAYQKMLIDDCK